MTRTDDPPDDTTYREATNIGHVWLPSLRSVPLTYD